jgi:hypothetical protein
MISQGLLSAHLNLEISYNQGKPIPLFVVVVWVGGQTSEHWKRYHQYQNLAHPMVPIWILWSMTMSKLSCLLAASATSNRLGAGFPN